MVHAACSIRSSRSLSPCRMLRPPRPLAEQLSSLELLVRLGGSMKFTLSGGGAISGEVQAMRGGLARMGPLSLRLLVSESVSSPSWCVARCILAGMGPGRRLGVLCAALLRVLCAMRCSSQAAFSCPLVQGYGRGLASQSLRRLEPTLSQLRLQGSPRPAEAPRRAGQFFFFCVGLQSTDLALAKDPEPLGREPKLRFGLCRHQPRPLGSQHRGGGHTLGLHRGYPALRARGPSV